TLVVLSVAGAALGWLRPPQDPGHATRSVIDLGEISLRFVTDEIIVSPDGSRFAVTGTAGGQRLLHWREAAEENFRPIPGTQNAFEAAFSPEGDWIVYVTDEALLKVSLAGGAPVPVVRSGAGSLHGPHWGDDGTIVFTGEAGLYRVSSTGGEPVLLLHRSDQGFITPSLLPGGEAVIGNRPGGGIMLLDLETDSVRELVSDGFDPQYVETGHVLYADASGGLWAVPFDAKRREVLGGAVPIFDGLSVVPFESSFLARYSVSRNGTLVYGAGGRGFAPPQQRLLVVDLEGNQAFTPLGPRSFYHLRWSPDGESVVYSGTEPGEFRDPDIYTYNVALRTAPRRLTFEGSNYVPIWSPDGTRVAFTSSRDGTDQHDLFMKTVDDDSPPKLIVSLPGFQGPHDWLRDDLLLFKSGFPSDLWTVDLSSDSAVTSPYLALEAELSDVSVSSDGTLAAYTSDESGTSEVYIRSFPEARQPDIVSQGGGVSPLWSPDGNTIYYLTLGTGSEIKNLIAT
ncbi:MAG: hypothetical protein ACE10G_06155, partial [Gemmatimonadales bacterium]